MDSFIIPQGDELIKRLRLKKYGGGLYSVRYLSFATGGLIKMPVKKTGQFETKEAATDWAKKHLRDYMVKELQLLERQNWRSNSKVTQLVHDYSEWRREDQPRSAQQDLSMLTNFGVPVFVSVMKLNDCNEWGEFGEELSEWLKKEAQTREGESLAISSCNKVINSLNHFMKWLKRKKHIEYKNYRQFEAFDQRKNNRRGHEDLVTPEVFKAVCAT